ncbi:MAG: hypothetical protein QM270_07035 [Bacillota bacterium]|nr:hypothetical protein [Bacillota bacterium]
MIEEPIFWDKLIYDEDGFVAGLSEDATPEERKAYEEYLKAERLAEAEGDKL